MTAEDDLFELEACAFTDTQFVELTDDSAVVQTPIPHDV